MKMTRASASLLSLFGAPVVGTLLVLPIIVLNGAVPLFLAVTFVLAACAGFFSTRIYFAAWYVRDKGRHPAWSVAACLGMIGWFMLWLMQDTNEPYKPILKHVFITCGGCGKTFYSEDCPEELCRDCQASIGGKAINSGNGPNPQ